MTKYIPLPIEYETYSFEEVMEAGRKANPLRCEVPWAFDFKGCQFTHESDRHYVVS